MAKGKKKNSKKPVSKRTGGTSSKKNEVRALAKRLDRFIDEHGVTYDDLAMAGVGVLATTLPDKKRKKSYKRAGKDFKRLVKRGGRLAPDGVLPAPEWTDESAPAGLEDPIISYQSVGGGWYVIEVAGSEIERLQGETDAAERAGELLSAYAALDANGQRSSATDISHTGGGWYEVIVQGVPIGRVRGKEATMERYGHLLLPQEVEFED